MKQNHKNDVLYLRISSYLKMSSIYTAATAFCVAVGLSGTVQAESLQVWDIYGSGAESPVMETLNKRFEAAHPGVTIDRTKRSFDDLALTLKLAVSAGDGPEVTKVNQGAGDMGTMVKEGLLLPIDSYIEGYGWDKKQSQSVLARDRWSKDGQFGSGETYGISHLGELIGLFYNAKVLADAGISKPPATFEELLVDLETLKKHGTSPFMIGTSNGHMALHMLAAISQAHIDASNRKSLDDLIYGQGGTWKTKGNLESAQLVQKWANDGYFFPGYQGIGGDDSIPLFLAGQAGFLISGSWYFGQMKSNPDIHFMAIPAPKGIKAPLTVGGVDLAWSISKIADTKEKQDLAASYIDYMVSDEAAVLWANAGFLPAIALPKDVSVKVPTLLREGINVWEELNENNALGHYPDWASPTMLRTFDDNTPLLLANRQTPEEFIDNLEADYVDYMSNK